LIIDAGSTKQNIRHRLIHVKQVSVASATLFTGFSIGTALAPNLASFFVFRILTAFQGTAFLIIGSAVIGDIYKPVSYTSTTTKAPTAYSRCHGYDQDVYTKNLFTRDLAWMLLHSRGHSPRQICPRLTCLQTERATALGWFLSGTLIGPALGTYIILHLQSSLTQTGPFIGGIIVTFRSWRDIFWLQTALAAAATVFCFFLQPETIHEKRATELEGLPRKQKAKKMWQWLNPLRVISLYRYPNLLLIVSCLLLTPNLPTR
jgi:MFS family permease